MTFEGWPWALGPAVATIYARSAQMGNGNTLEPQILRCRAYAKHLGLSVSAVFTDCGSGDVALLSGMVSMLNFITLGAPTLHVVIVDDISRLGRDIDANARLRRKLEEAGAELLTPASAFGGGSATVLCENIMAAMVQFQRAANRHRVIDLLKARMNSGYYVFSAPCGYKYHDIGGQKILVPCNPLAVTIREAIEGFADGHFHSKSDVRRFLEGQPAYPKCAAGYVRNKRVNTLLTNVLYAGYIERPSWGIPLTKGKHYGLVSLGTYKRVQKRLAGSR